MTIVLETTTVFTTVAGSEIGSKIDEISVTVSVVAREERVVEAKVLLETWRLTCLGK